MSNGAVNRVYDNAALGVRFEIDDSFVDGSVVETAVDAPGNVQSTYLAARGREGSQAMLSISRVEVGYDTSPHELAEQLVIHNRYAAHTAEQHGWTIHSPWKATMLSGYPAMHCDYVVPEPATRPEPADEPALPFAPPAGEPSAPGHLQAWLVYAGRTTYQLHLQREPARRPHAQPRRRRRRCAHAADQPRHARGLGHRHAMSPGLREFRSAPTFGRR